MASITHLYQSAYVSVKKYFQKFKKATFSFYSNGIDDEFLIENNIGLNNNSGSGKKVIVQGLGNVGYYTTKFFREGGAKVIAIAEFEGAIYNADGLNEEDVFQHRKKTGSILNFPGATNIANSGDALEMECDILIPAALENVIDKNNAPRIKAKIIGAIPKKYSIKYGIPALPVDISTGKRIILRPANGPLSIK